MRIGQGFDVHRLVDGRPLLLGGVIIPYRQGLLGHSDADVLAHAVMDALLGASGLGDIGQLFPDGDPKYEGADSMALLRDVAARVRFAGFQVVNVDTTVVAQLPRLSPYIPAIRENLARILTLEVSCVSVKATTEEGLGYTGRGEGISAMAVALLT